MTSVADVACMGLQSVVGGHLLVDPSAGEERVQDGAALVALMPARNQVTQLHLEGAWAEAQAAQVSTTRA